MALQQSLDQDGSDAGQAVIHSRCDEEQHQISKADIYCVTPQALKDFSIERCINFRIIYCNLMKKLPLKSSGRGFNSHPPAKCDTR